MDSATYNERGQLATLGQGTSGNGNYLTTTFTYDDSSTKRGWLTRVQATSNNGATTLLDLNMGYTLNGNISSVSQNASGDPNNPTFTNSFAYDGLDRLRVVTSTLFLNETYTFDTLGRMTSRTIGGTNYTLAYSDTAHIDAPTYYSRTGSYGYDDNGNQTSGTVNGTSQTRSVDAENRVTQVVTGTTTLTFVYDANGKRIVQTVAPLLGKTSRTLYIGNLYEEDITNGSSNTYLLGEKYLNPTDYFTGNDAADNEHMYVGADNDINRLTLNPPLRDTRGYKDYLRFGSAHVGGCNMLYCDGRVEVVAYDVDPAVHQRAGDRR